MGWLHLKCFYAEWLQFLAKALSGSGYMGNRCRFKILCSGRTRKAGGSRTRTWNPRTWDQWLFQLRYVRMRYSCFEPLYSFFKSMEWLVSRYGKWCDCVVASRVVQFILIKNWFVWVDNSVHWCSDDDGYLPHVSDNRVRFPPFAQEARYGFSLQARPRTFRRRL